MSAILISMGIGMVGALALLFVVMTILRDINEHMERIEAVQLAEIQHHRKLLANDNALLEAMTMPDSERVIKVPLKAVIAAIRRLDNSEGVKLIETTAEREARNRKQNRQDRERKLENGFIYSMVQDEIEEMKNEM